MRLARELFEQREIIENPERAAVRRGDDLALARVDREVAHLHAGQVERERLPVRAAVEADIDRAARAREQQAAARADPGARRRRIDRRECRCVIAVQCAP